jgi:small-conductance mechanosensitive channel
MITMVARVLFLAAAEPTPSATPTDGPTNTPPPVNFTGITDMLVANVIPILVIIAAIVAISLGLTGRLSKVFNIVGVVLVAVGLVGFAAASHWWGPSIVHAIFGTGR